MLWDNFFLFSYTYTNTYVIHNNFVFIFQMYALVVHVLTEAPAFPMD